jgi:hypothetical protein
VVLFVNGPTALDVPVKVESLTRVVANVAEVESWTRYDVAPAEASQLSVWASGWFVAPFAGAESVGAEGGTTTVVKLNVVEYALVPPALVALTRQ